MSEETKLWTKREFLLFLQEQMKLEAMKEDRAAMCREYALLRQWAKRPKGVIGRPRKATLENIGENIHEIVLREATNGEEI